MTAVLATTTAAGVLVAAGLAPAAIMIFLAGAALMGLGATLPPSDRRRRPPRHPRRPPATAIAKKPYAAIGRVPR